MATWRRGVRRSCKKGNTPVPKRDTPVLHWKRKLFHASGVAIVAIYVGFELERPVAAGLLAGVTFLLFLLDAVRSWLPAVQRVFAASFRVLLESKDRVGMNGATLYFAGCALAAALAPKAPACGGILALALGDPAAALVGSAVRSPRLGPRASLAGSTACFVAASAGCAFLVPWPVALAGGAAAAVLEAVAGSKLDNLAIPAGTALVLHLLT